MNDNELEKLKQYIGKCVIYRGTKYKLIDAVGIGFSKIQNLKPNQSQQCSEFNNYSVDCVMENMNTHEIIKEKCVFIDDFDFD